MTELDGKALLRIDRAVERFEDDWQAGARPSLEALLDSEPDHQARAVLLRYALAVELEFRRRLGEAPGRGEYDRRFSDHLPAIETAFAEESTSRILSSTTVDSPAALPRTLGAGSEAGRFGKYEVVGPLGDGGQGAAFLARDPDIGRLVVVKRYHALGGDAAREAKALGRVNSPYTARCLEVMRHNGELFLVMEYIAGRSLSELLKRDPLAPHAAARLAEQVAEGLEAVHACGLVHRDVKPSNVILGDDGVARLVDFGLAAHLGSEALCRDISGSPPYMSPEQARGQWERIDARSDVYGLGGVLYALLTGRPPHPGTTVDEMLRHAREGVVTPPRELSPKRPIPRDLERVMMQALEPDPARRYASSADLRRALLRSRRVPALRATIAALAAATALGMTAWLLARPELVRKPPGDDQVGAVVPPGGTRSVAEAARNPPMVEQAAAALEGELLVRVHSRSKPGLGVFEPGALPLLAGDQVQVEAQLSRPAYVYLLWIDNEGEVTVLYPRDDGLFGSQPGAERPRKSVQSPAAANQGIPMTGPGGLETALLLARHKPLPPGTNLAGLVGRMPHAPLRDAREVALLDYDSARRSAIPLESQHRGIGTGKVEEIDNPIQRLMARLRDLEHFEVIKAVRFAYYGQSAPGPLPGPPERNPAPTPVGRSKAEKGPDGAAVGPGEGAYFNPRKDPGFGKTTDET